MAAIISRQGLIDYCLRALGEPVVEVNVDDSQLDDRVDEALEYWRQYHWDGIEKVYLKHQIQASELYLTTGNATSFILSEILTGSISGAKAVVCSETSRKSDNNFLLMKNVVGSKLPEAELIAMTEARVRA